ncbi:hypothetical protein [Novipirellula caenicola]|uniref:Uncharacterized protein n=1 Tax=Novipirellula caenicola TaxID=1536901 RepID=A0ABP9VY26_9BACT
MSFQNSPGGGGDCGCDETCELWATTAANDVRLLPPTDWRLDCSFHTYDGESTRELVVKRSDDSIWLKITLDYFPSGLKVVYNEWELPYEHRWIITVECDGETRERLIPVKSGFAMKVKVAFDGNTLLVNAAPMLKVYDVLAEPSGDIVRRWWEQENWLEFTPTTPSGKLSASFTLPDGDLANYPSIAGSIIANNQTNLAESRFLDCPPLAACVRRSNRRQLRMSVLSVTTPGGSFTGFVDPRPNDPFLDPPNYHATRDRTLIYNGCNYSEAIYGEIYINARMAREILLVQDAVHGIENTPSPITQSVAFRTPQVHASVWIAGIDESTNEFIVSANLYTVVDLRNSAVETSTQFANLWAGSGQTNDQYGPQTAIDAGDFSYVTTASSGTKWGPCKKRPSGPVMWLVSGHPALAEIGNRVTSPILTQWQKRIPIFDDTPPTITFGPDDLVGEDLETTFYRLTSIELSWAGGVHTVRHHAAPFTKNDFELVVGAP